MKISNLSIGNMWRHEGDDVIYLKIGTVGDTARSLCLVGRPLFPAGSSHYVTTDSSNSNKNLGKAPPLILALIGEPYDS